MRLLPHEVAIGIIGDEFDDAIFPNPKTAFDGKDDALKFLRELTENDCGIDVQKWREWFAACTAEELDLHYDEWTRKCRGD